MNDQTKTCKNCGAWQPSAEKGQCRKNAPVTGGWPATDATDWCLQWSKAGAPKKFFAPQAKRMESWQLGINYAFVRDYPADAANWLKAAMAEPDKIPAKLRPVLDNVFGEVWTEKLPDLGEDGTGYETIFLWAEKLPGFFNEDAPEEDLGLLMTMQEPDEIQASHLALSGIAESHPWRTMATVDAPQKKRK